jgi:F0F1-type ATP synthase membrane subunit a
VIKLLVQQDSGGRMAADEFLYSLQGYFSRPVSESNRIFGVVLLALVILLILFIMVRTIMFIWKGNKKDTLL